MTPTAPLYWTSRRGKLVWGISMNHQQFIGKWIYSSLQTDDEKERARDVKTVGIMT
jgi:hypothetical protein